jgi:LysR family glycine cleavage system transcriptional activator
MKSANSESAKSAAGESGAASSAAPVVGAAGGTRVIAGSGRAMQAGTAPAAQRSGGREIPFPSLVAFEATARLGSVSRAADELNLTQSAVSQRVLKLEAHVGQRLFIRLSHGVRLTGAGELLLLTTRDTLERLRAGFERIAPYRNKASLLLACPADFAHGWLMPRMAALKALHRELEVWLMAEQEMTDIDRIDVDLIVSRRPLRTDHVECRPLLDDRGVAVCGPATAAQLGSTAYPKLLEKAPLLLLEREPEWGGLLATPACKTLRIRRSATIQDERLLLDAAEQELGIAYVSQVLAAGSLAGGRVVLLPRVPVTPRASLWVMRSTLTPRTPLANHVFDWLLVQGHSGLG